MKIGDYVKYIGFNPSYTGRSGIVEIYNNGVCLVNFGLGDTKYVSAWNLKVARAKKIKVRSVKTSKLWNV